MAAPRPYQSDALEAAKERNILLVLPTNAGKTRVATLLIEWFLKTTPRVRTSPKKVVFLAPTCPLVEQQYNVLLQATSAYGDDGASHLIALACGLQKRTKAKEALPEWSARIVVSTPELLVKGLVHADVCMKDIGLLVLDEAHHCVNGDSYRIIMHRFYTSVASHDRPRILAMTASPFKGVAEAKASEKGKLEDALHRIESLLHCRTWTQDIANILQLHTNCKQSRHATTSQEGIATGAVRELGNELLQMVRESGGPAEKSLASSFVIRFDKYILQTLGLWAACHFLSILSDHSSGPGAQEEDLLADLGGLGSPSASESRDAEAASRQGGLEGADFSALATKFQQWRRRNPRVESEVLQRPMDHASDKLLKLKELLEKELSCTESSKALVFMEQRQTARIVADFLQACGGPIGGRTGFVMSNRQAGNNPRMSASPSVTKDHLQRFRETDPTSDSYLSVLCTTSVLCEGIDVRSCVLVISFDMPHTPLQNIQQRGRARAMEACYVHMVGGGEDEEKLRQFCLHETLLKELLEERSIAAGQAPPLPLPQALPIDEEVLIVQETGALLPVERAKAFLEAIYAECSEEEGTSLDFLVKVLNGPVFTASIRLPPLTCADMVDEEEVQLSGAKSTKRGAENAVALLACHRLRELGVLDDNLRVVGRSMVLRAKACLDLQGGKSQKQRSDDLAALKMKEELVRVLPSCLRHSNGWVLHALDGIPGMLPREGTGERIGLLLPRSVPHGRLSFALQHHGSVFELLLRAVGEVELASEFVEELSSWTQGCLEVANVEAKCTHRAEPHIKLNPTTGAYVQASSDVTLGDGGALEGAGMSKQWDLEAAVWLLMPYQDGVLVPDWSRVRVGIQQMQAASSDWPSLALDPSAGIVQMPDSACSFPLQDALVLHEECGGKREALFGELHPPSPEGSQATTTLRGTRVSRTNINAVCSIKSKAKVCPTGLTLEVAKCKVAPLSFGQFQLLQLLPSILWRLEHVALCVEVSEELASRGELLRTSPRQLAEALTHGRAACLPVDPSFCDRPFHYERLEFFGDALLKFCSAVHSCKSWPDADVEVLSKASQKFQTNKYLHKCGKALPLRDALLARSFERRTNLTDLRRQQVSVKEQADIVEAFLGAVFAAGLPGLEGAFAAVWAAFHTTILASKQESAVWSLRSTVQDMREMWPTEDRVEKEWLDQEERVQQVETVLDYSFQRRSFLSIILPRHPRSREEEREFQRLEFLGDAVLQAMASKKVIDELPTLDEGGMSDVRAGLVCNKFLARRIARRFGAFAGDLLFHARPAMRKKVNDYASKVVQPGRDQWEADYVLGKTGHHDCSAAAVSTLFKLVLDVAQEHNGGSFLDGPKDVADVYEALMGAVFIDTGGDLERTWAVFEEDFAVPQELILRRQQERRDEQAREALQGQPPVGPASDHASEAPEQQRSGRSDVDGCGVDTQITPAEAATGEGGLEGRCTGPRGGSNANVLGGRTRAAAAQAPPEGLTAQPQETPFIAGQDYKSQLNLHVMQAGCEYCLVQHRGLPHEMVFTSQVKIRAKDLVCVGNPRSTRQDSEQAAAFEALRQLGKIQTDGTSFKGRDYKSSLNQCLMQDPQSSCQYRRVSATGAGNDALFVSNVEIAFLGILCQGEACKTIKASEHSAAFAALLRLRIIGATSSR